MTKYRLKDVALQKKLDELSNGTFSELIATSGGVFAREDKSLLKLGNGRFIVVLHKEAFEAVYDPDNWNNYPEVMPPEGVLMRAEVSWYGRIHRVCAIFEKGGWRSTKNGKAAIAACGGCYELTFDDVKRFRPWE